MNKRILLTLLTALCCFSLVACGGDASSDSDDDERVVSEESDDEDEDDEDEDEGKDKPEVTEAPEATEEPKATEEPEATEEPQATEEPEATKKPVADVPTELSDDLYSFQVSINGEIYQFPMWYEDFTACGWECTEDTSTKLKSNQYYGSAVFTKDGYKFYVGLANLSLNSVTLDKAMVYGIQLDDYYLKDNNWKFVLPKGITRGVSTKEDIIAAYGEPNDEYNGSNYDKLTYEYDSYQEIELYISSETKTLNEFEIKNMIELEGADNSINPEVPEMAKNYVAPEALSDSLYDFTVSLEGNLYELPCPVSVFLANGFTINEERSNMEIGSGSNGWVEFKYNNITYRAYVKNYADYATIAENCFVTTLKTSEYDPLFDMTVPGNIKRGITEAELLTIIENYNYEKDESGDFIYYNIFDPDESRLDGYDIVIREGKVHSIEVQHSPKMD